MSFITDALFGDPGEAVENAAAQSAATTQQAMQIQKEMQEKGMEAFKEYSGKSLAAQLAAQQGAYDIGRWGYQQGASQLAPYRTASLSALQALPELQYLLGLTPYAVPTSTPSSTPPAMNFAQMAAQGGAPAGGTAGGAGNMTVPGISLTPYTGAFAGMEGSPLYQWQQKQAMDTLSGQLASAGLSGSTYAQREAARVNESLAAQERERRVRDLQSMVNLGMGGSSATSNMLGAASGLPSIAGGAGAANAYNNMAQGLAGMYSGMGASQGQGLLSLAQQQTAAGNALAQIPSPGSQLLNLGLTAYGMGAFGGGTFPFMSSAASGPLAGMASYGLTGRGIGSRFPS